MLQRSLIAACWLIVSLSLRAQDSKEIEKGDLAMHQGAYLQAAAAYIKAIGESQTAILANEKLGRAYMAMGDYTDAEKVYSRLSFITPDGSLDRFYYAQMLRHNGKYSEADKAYQAYFRVHPNDPLAADFQDFAARAQRLMTDTDIYSVINIPENTSASEVGPTFCFYFFCYSSNHHSAKDNYDLYMQHGGNPSNPPAPQKLKGEVNRSLTEGPATFSRDGHEMIMTSSNYGHKNSDGRMKVGLYHADYDSASQQWVNVTALNFVDYEYNYMQPSLSPDGSMLFFASDMPGGFGETDIYVCYRQGNIWSTPVNLGSGINTMGKEQTPFISGNGTLYFASDSRMGLGGLDIYAATLSGGVWGRATDLGAPINSAYDDFGYINSTKDNSGYFVSDRPGGKGGDDIYQFFLLARKH